MELDTSLILSANQKKAVHLVPKQLE
jgi:hypothetical protein